MNAKKLLLFLFLDIFFTNTQPIAAILLENTFVLNQQDSTKINTDSLSVKKTPLKKFVNFNSIVNGHWDASWKISSLKLHSYLYEDIGDFVGLMPGTFVFDLGSAGQALMFARQGSAVNQAITYFDGRPLYDPMTGEYDLNLLPVGFVQEMKIEQNISTINMLNSGEILFIKSDKYEGDVPFSQIYHHKAGLGYSDVDFVFGQRISRKMNILVGGDIKSFDGEKNAYLYGHQNFRGKLDYNFSPGWSFTYSLMSNKLDRNTPGPILDSGNYSAANAKLEKQRYDHTLNIFGNLLHPTWQNFRANIYYSSLYSKQTDNTVDLKNVNESRYAGINFQIKQKSFGQLFTVGSKFEHDWIDGAEVGKKKHSFGSFVFQDDWAWREKFGLRGLASLNFHELFGTNFTGGLSSYLKISKNLKWNLLAQQTLGYPSFIELYAASSVNGSLDLKNEIVQKIETGVESKILTNLQIKTFFYWKNIQQHIHYQVIDSTQASFQNEGDLQIYGLDFLLDWKPGANFQINTIVTALDNQNLYDFPDLQISGNIQYNNRFFQDYMNTIIRLEGRYKGARKSIVLHPYLYSSSNRKLPPAFILNATAIFGFGKLNIFFMFENILNENYQIIYGFPMRDRTFHYGLRWEFWD